MAGSYGHLFHGYSMIENMGDAIECIEELHWLVERAIGRERACQLLDQEFYPMVRGELKMDKFLKKIQNLEKK